MCKIVFSITFNVSFWCSKEPSHREDFLRTKNVYLKILLLGCLLGPRLPQIFIIIGIIIGLDTVCTN